MVSFPSVQKEKKKKRLFLYLSVLFGLEPEDRNLNCSLSSSADTVKCLIVIIPVAGKWNFCKMAFCLKIGFTFDFGGVGCCI